MNKVAKLNFKTYPILTGEKKLKILKKRPEQLMLTHQDYDLGYGPG